MDCGTAMALGILAAALVWDWFLGEYPAPLHPVVWMGWLISGLLRLAPRFGWWRQLIFGAFLTTGVVTFCTGVVLLVVYLSDVMPLLALLPGAYFLKASFALRELGAAAERVRQQVEVGNLPAAREALRLPCAAVTQANWTAKHYSRRRCNPLAEEHFGQLRGPALLLPAVRRARGAGLSGHQYDGCDDRLSRQV